MNKQALMTNEVERHARQHLEEVSRNDMARLSLIIAILVLTMLIIVGLNWIAQQKQALKLAAKEQELLMQEKELIGTREKFQTQALLLAKQKLTDKEVALEESTKRIDLKDVLIRELEMKLTVNAQEKIGHIEADALQNLKILTAEDWRKFRLLFEQRFPYFFLNLIERFPKLTAAEMRLLVLIKIGFDANEIANILGISSSSVYKSRYRLRKKLGLIEEDDLEGFVQGV